MNDYKSLFDESGQIIDLAKIIDKSTKFIITIDTRDWHFVISPKKDNRRSRHPSLNESVKSEWMTLEQVIERIKIWKEKKFTWSRDFWDFKYITIFWDKRGYSWCDRKHYHFPEETIISVWDYRKSAEDLQKERWETTHSE